MKEHGLRWHLMTEIEERGAEAVIADAIAEALDGPDSIYLSLDIDVIDPGMAPGTGTPEPGGMLTREVLRAVRQIVGARRARRHGHRRGLAAVRPSPRRRRWPPIARARGDQRAGREEGRRPLRRGSSADRPRARRRPDAAGRDPLDPYDPAATALPAPRRPRRSPSPGSTTSTSLEDPGDLDLYLALAGRTGGPILELAAGTGRLAVPLADAGYDVTGVDLDPAMLARARARRAATGGGAVGGPALRDRRRPLGPPARRRPLRSSRSSPSTRCSSSAAGPTSRRVLATMAAHLAPGGLAVVDVWLPDADDLARYDGRIILEYPRRDPATGAARGQDRQRRPRRGDRRRST